MMAGANLQSRQEMFFLGGKSLLPVADQYDQIKFSVHNGGASTKPSMPSSFNGINLLKLPCHSLKKTHAFYTEVFPFKPLPQYNRYTPEHKLFAMMFMHEPTKLIVEVRHYPAEADAQKSWDPITWGVGTRKDLEE
jgi:hypothetical protein